MLFSWSGCRGNLNIVEECEVHIGNLTKYIYLMIPVLVTPRPYVLKSTPTELSLGDKYVCCTKLCPTCPIFIAKRITWAFYLWPEKWHEPVPLLIKLNDATTTQLLSQPCNFFFCVSYHLKLHNLAVHDKVWDINYERYFSSKYCLFSGWNNRISNNLHAIFY